MPCSYSPWFFSPKLRERQEQREKAGTIEFRHYTENGLTQHHLMQPSLGETLEAFELFLKGAGFVFEGELTIVNEND